MTELLSRPPYGQRDDATLLRELNLLTAHHRAHCEPYARITAHAPAPASTLDEVPFVHVGVFKRVELRTLAAGMKHQRVLSSSATTGASASRIALDDRSSALQNESTRALLVSWLGPELRPLLVLDAASSLVRRGEVSARIAAAMSLRPLSTELSFLMRDPADPASVDWAEVARLARTSSELLVYGFTWLLWSAWAQAEIPAEARVALSRARVVFVHSGGWKKLESIAVPRTSFEGSLLATAAAGSTVLDYYGLVEQVGIIYPLCSAGFRHVPVWADARVRDPYTLRSLVGEIGQLQLMNPLAWGAPYHSVLTEDLGRLDVSDCPCGRRGPRFELLGRVPKSEVRGCANV